METGAVMVLSLVFIGPVSSECTSSDLCAYSGASLENTPIQSVAKENIFPKSCATTCVGQKWCLGVVDDKENRKCIFHIERGEGRCPFLQSMESGQTLYLNTYYSGSCLSVGVNP